MVADSHRLPALEMGVAGHHRSRIPVRLIHQHLLKRENRSAYLIDLSPAVEPRIGRDLVVAGARGVQFSARCADPFRQLGLDVHVDILQRGLELELPFADVSLDFAEAFLDGGKLLTGQQPGLALGAGMGDGPGDIVGEQPPVIGDGFAELLNQRRGILGKSSFPHILETSVVINAGRDGLALRLMVFERDIAFDHHAVFEMDQPGDFQRVARDQAGHAERLQRIDELVFAG